ncbi:hypothetical protein BGZ63DRAFT_109749 [Mariannaea sp. PMI_226]|nr:hypothetical protein BGZ63DRAFT_109749 [Mariannaea sp. PMI_226]
MRMLSSSLVFSNSPSLAKPFVELPLVFDQEEITPCHWPVGTGRSQSDASSSRLVSFSWPPPLLFDDCNIGFGYPVIDPREPTKPAISSGANLVVANPSYPTAAITSFQQSHHRCRHHIPFQNKSPRQLSSIRPGQLRASPTSVCLPRHLVCLRVKSRKSSPYPLSAVVWTAVPTACSPRIPNHLKCHPPRPSQPP